MKSVQDYQDVFQHLSLPSDYQLEEPIMKIILTFLCLTLGFLKIRVQLICSEIVIFYSF